MIITKNITKYTISISTSLKTALGKLNSNSLRVLFCVDKNLHLRGSLTAGDINRWLLSKDSNSTNVVVSEVCNLKPIKALESSSNLEIENLLEKVAYLPILDAEGKLLEIAYKRSLRKSFQVGDKLVGNRFNCFVIAEIGNNHNGSLDLAKTLIEKAAEAGADCAKFQMRDLTSLYKNKGNSFDEKENLGSQYTLDLLNKFQLCNDDLFNAFEYCKELGILPLCTPWDENSVKSLEDYGVVAYKVASADLTNHSLLRCLSKTKKPLICSTGMSREDEIIESVDLLKSNGVDFALLHCNSTYPTPFKDINLKYIDRLCQIGDCEVGYSGHERDIFVAIAAVARGASIIEKHITIDRGMEGNDHKVSLLPEDFKAMVKGISQVKESLGESYTRELTQGEMMNRVTLAKSVFANCGISKGEIIEKSMLEIKSPGNGLQPNRLHELVGKKSKRDIDIGDVFFPSDLCYEGFAARNYVFNTKWGLPVRHHDYKKLLKLTNLEVLEFHLSYKDLELNFDEFFEDKLPHHLVIHAPELFSGDHTLDLASNDENYRIHSIQEMKRVVEFAKKLKKYFKQPKDRVGIITNVGGFSQDEHMSEKEAMTCREILVKSLLELNDSEIEIWPQTMPPFPWHYGGQRFHNLFVRSEDIVEFCTNNKMTVCLDVSHSKLACNHLNLSFEKFLDDVLPHTSHVHIADSKGVDGEGLQINEGEIDFYTIGKLLQNQSREITWIPEVWQAHENNGEGFWYALHELEKLSSF